MKHGFALQVGLAERSQAIYDGRDRRIRNGNQNHGSGKNAWRQVTGAATATNGANSAARGGLAPRNHGVNLPTLLAQAAAQRSTNSPRADNGNCRFPHYARIPCGTFQHQFMRLPGLIFFGIIAFFWIAYGLRTALGALTLPWLKDCAPAEDSECPRVTLAVCGAR